MSGPKEFPDRLDEGCEKKRGVKDDFHMFGLNRGNDVVTVK